MKLPYAVNDAYLDRVDAITDGWKAVMLRRCRDARSSAERLALIRGVQACGEEVRRHLSAYEVARTNSAAREALK